MKVLVSFLMSCTVVLFLCAQPAFSQGSLAPPGPPASMMRTLEQIEPRIPITNLPWTISSPGSYYLVTNLVGDAVAPDGIIVQVPDVTIDLRGFVLQGGAAGGNGIAVYNPVTNLKVYNGVIRDWMNSGIFAVSADFGELKELRVSNNMGFNGIGIGWTVADCVFANNFNSPGLYTTGRSTLKSCTATGNGGAGFALGTNSVISGCTASFNFMGIVTFQGGRVVDCTAEGNAMNGFFAGPSTSLSGCIARENLQDGFSVMQNGRVANCVAEMNQWNGFFTSNAFGPGPFARSGCKISGCTATENLQDGFNVGDASTVENCVATLNQGDGIEVGCFCYVLVNTCDQNGFQMWASGIKAGNQNRIDGNSVSRNAFAGIDCSVSIGNLIVRNSASQNGVDYAVVAGNHQALITAFPGLNFVTSPWDNFQY